MPAKKNTSESAKRAEVAAELSETLRHAAELEKQLAGEETVQPTEAKKPAAKKPAAKKTTATKPASKAPAKKPTAKKPATKAQKPAAAKTEEQAEAVEPVEEQPVEEQPVEQPVVEQPVEEKPEAQPVAEQPVEEKPVEPAEDKVTEQPVAEQPVEQKPAEQPAPVQAQPVATNGRGSAFAQKSTDFINNKGKLPLFIIANLLLLLSSIFLLAGAFSIPSPNGKPITGNLFTYYGNRTAIIAHWQSTAGAWASGGYTMMGILMFFSFLVPLALVVKNIVFFVLKKDKNVHMFDAIIVFAFLIAYLGVVNLYGANTTWSHVLSLIMSVILLAFTIFVIIIETRGRGKAMPYFSIANIVLVVLCMFLLTSNKIYNAAGWYGAHAAAASGGGGFAFILLLISLAALVLLVVMQVKKLPNKIEYFLQFIVPAAAGGCALIALISFAGGKPTGLSMGGGFVFGCILTLLFAAADIVFAVVPKLHKYNVKVTDRMEGEVSSKPVAQPVAQTAEQPAAAPATEQPAQPAEQPAQPAGVKCPACGQENEPGAVFCARCGRKLK